MRLNIPYRIHQIFLGLITFISSALPFLSSLPRMIGEPFDTRFQIVIHEHWYWVLQFERNLRDVHIFYPFDKTLGFSDIFFGNGILYSFFRFAGLDILDAWTFTNFLILLLGNVGFALLLNSLLRNKFLIYLSLLVMTNTYAFLGFLNIWPNTVGYALVSWVLFFIYKIYHSSENKFLVWVNYLLIFLPLLTLSYWYPGFFSIIGTVMFLIFAFLSKNRGLKTKIKLLLSKASMLKILRFSPIWLVLWGLFLYVTLPTLGNLNRAPGEILEGSLSVNDFFSIDLLEPNIIKSIFSVFFDVNWLSANSKWAVGFPILTIILFIFLSATSIRKILHFDSLQSYTAILIFLALLLTVRINEFGLYILLWQNFDLLGIIRTPVRLNILINFLLILFIFKSLDNYLLNHRGSRFLILMIASVLVVDQFRLLPGSWSKNSFIDKNLLKTQESIPNDCEYIVLVNKGAGHWSDTIEGMVLSSLTNIPTINGYSGTHPSDSIQRNWSDPSEYVYVTDYINRNQLSNQGCAVDNKSYNRLSIQNPLFTTVGNTENLWESNKNKTWIWIEDTFINVQIINPFEVHTLQENFLVIEMASCLTKLNLEITLNNEKFTLSFDKNNRTSTLRLPEVAPDNSNSLAIMSDQAGCQVEPDPRGLIYSIGYK